MFMQGANRHAVLVGIERSHSEVTIQGLEPGVPLASLSEIIHSRHVVLLARRDHSEVVVAIRDGRFELVGKGIHLLLFVWRDISLGESRRRLGVIHSWSVRRCSGPGSVRV